MGCRRSGEGHICSCCRQTHFALRLSSVSGTTLYTLGAYGGLLSDCILAAKTKGQRAVASELAELASEIWRTTESVSGLAQYVMPIPSSVEGEKFRGFNLPNLLAEAFQQRCALAPVPMEVRSAFRRARHTSKGLSAAERLSRLGTPATDADGDGVERGRLLLIDDVVTTGATLSQAIDQAKKLGFSSVICFALAEHQPL